MTTTAPQPTDTQTGTLNLWSSDDSTVTVIHHFGDAESRIEIRKAGEAEPVQVIKTTRFWRAEQAQAIDLAKRLATGEPIVALTDADAEPVEA